MKMEQQQKQKQKKKSMRQMIDKIVGRKLVCLSEQNEMRLDSA